VIFFIDDAGDAAADVHIGAAGQWSGHAAAQACLSPTLSLPGTHLPGL